MAESQFAKRIETKIESYANYKAEQANSNSDIHVHRLNEFKKYHHRDITIEYEKHILTVEEEKQTLRDLETAYYNLFKLIIFVVDPITNESGLDMLNKLLIQSIKNSINKDKFLSDEEAMQMPIMSKILELEEADLTNEENLKHLFNAIYTDATLYKSKVTRHLFRDPPRYLLRKLANEIISHIDEYIEMNKSNVYNLNSKRFIFIKDNISFKLNKISKCIETLISSNIGFIFMRALTFSQLYNVEDTIDDIVQEGIIGFLHSLDYYSIYNENSNRILTLAGRSINRQILRYLKYGVLKNDREYMNAYDKLSEKLGRHPSFKELAEYLNAKEETVRYRILRLINSTPIRLDQSANLEEDRVPSTLYDIIDSKEPTPEDKYANYETREYLLNILTELLTKRELNIIKYSYGIFLDKNETHYTLEQIGEIYHISRERVRQIKDKAFKKIRKYAATHPEIKEEFILYLEDFSTNV